jgi:hypothetical protein
LEPGERKESAFTNSAELLGSMGSIAQSFSPRSVAFEMLSARPKTERKKGTRLFFLVFF